MGLGSRILVQCIVDSICWWTNAFLVTGMVDCTEPSHFLAVSLCYLVQPQYHCGYICCGFYQRFRSHTRKCGLNSALIA